MVVEEERIQEIAEELMRKKLENIAHVASARGTQLASSPMIGEQGAGLALVELSTIIFVEVLKED